MAVDVRREDHLDYYLAYVPVLGLTEKLEDVILWIQKKFKRNRAMMVFQNLDVVVSEALWMLDTDQKVVFYSRMGNVVQKTTEETSHHLQVRDVLHDLAMLHEIVEVACCFYDPEDVVVLGRFVRLVFDRVQQVLEVLLCDGELLKKAVRLEQLDSEVKQRSISEGLVVLEHIEVPFVQVVHNFDDVVPYPGVDVNQLFQPLLLFNLLVLVYLLVLTVDLLQEVIQVDFEPASGVACLVCGEVEPLLGIHIHIFLLAIHIKVQLVELVGLDDLDGLDCFLLDRLSQLVQVTDLLQYLDDTLNWVQVLVLVPELVLVAGDLPQDDDDDPDQPQYGDTLDHDLHLVEDVRQDDHEGVEEVE